MGVWGWVRVKLGFPLIDHVSDAFIVPTVPIRVTTDSLIVGIDHCFIHGGIIERGGITWYSNFRPCLRMGSSSYTDAGQTKLCMSVHHPHSFRILNSNHTASLHHRRRQVLSMTMMPSSLFVELLLSILKTRSF